MSILHATSSYPGLPNSGRLSGTDGDLVGIMDVILPANGWSIEYTSGNARVYRPGTGNRFRLHMNDAAASSGSAALCLVRGCENASGATTLVDPFPQTGQVADASANWIKSTATGTTARAFHAWVAPTWVMLAVNANGTANNWTLNFFGDYSPTLSGHAYNTLCTTRNSSGTAITVGPFSSWPITSLNSSASALLLFGARDYSGTVKSTQMGVVPLANNSTFGNVNGTQTMQNSPTTKIDTIKTMLIDFGTNSSAAASSLLMAQAGFLPNVLSPVHSGRGAVNSEDTYQNTSAGMATGRVFAGPSGLVVVQESDDWSPPSG